MEALRTASPETIHRLAHPHRKIMHGRRDSEWRCPTALKMPASNEAEIHRRLRHAFHAGDVGSLTALLAISCENIRKAFEIFLVRRGEMTLETRIVVESHGAAWRLDRRASGRSGVGWRFLVFCDWGKAGQETVFVREEHPLLIITTLRVCAVHCSGKRIVVCVTK